MPLETAPLQYAVGPLETAPLQYAVGPLETAPLQYAVGPTVLEATPLVVLIRTYQYAIRTVSIRARIDTLRIRMEIYPQIVELAGG